MFVLKKEMYHFNNSEKRKNLWVAGNTINTNNYVSDSWKSGLEFDAKLQFNSLGYFPFFSIIDAFLEKKQTSETYIQMLEESSRLLKCYSQLQRELILENIRKQYYSKLPSRLNSIYLCDSNQLEYWKEKLTIENVNLELFKVEVTGKIFKSNDSLLPKNGESYIVMKEQAKKYWEVDLTNLNDQKSEYLLQGKIKILEKCKI